MLPIDLKIINPWDDPTIFKWKKGIWAILLNFTCLLILTYIVGYPIRLFFPEWERVERQLNFKDENLKQLIVDSRKMLEDFQIDIYLTQTTWNKIGE